MRLTLSAEALAVETETAIERSVLIAVSATLAFHPNVRIRDRRKFRAASKYLLETSPPKEFLTEDLHLNIQGDPAAFALAAVDCYIHNFHYTDTGQILNGDLQDTAVKMYLQSSAWLDRADGQELQLPH